MDLIVGLLIVKLRCDKTLSIHTSALTLIGLSQQSFLYKLHVKLEFTTDADGRINLWCFRMTAYVKHMCSCSIWSHTEPLVLRVSHKAWPHHQLVMSAVVRLCLPLSLSPSNVCDNGEGGGLALPSVSQCLCLCFGGVTCYRRGKRRRRGGGQSLWNPDFG